MILLGLAAVLAIPVGCASPSQVAQTTISIPASTLITRPTSAPETPNTTLALTTASEADATPQGLTSAPESSGTAVVPPAPSLVVRPTTGEVVDFRALLPPVPPGLGEMGNHLVFFSNRSGNYQMYQIALDGSELVQFTQNYAYDIYDMEPAWSADGRIAFTTNHVNGS